MLIFFIYSLFFLIFVHIKFFINTEKREETIPKENEKEYVIDVKPPKPTLGIKFSHLNKSENMYNNVFNCFKAQKFGLIEYENNYLSEKEWENVKFKSNERDDHKQGCPICKENFDCDREQVLLSCSHVFHRVIDKLLDIITYIFYICYFYCNIQYIKCIQIQYK